MPQPRLPVIPEYITVHLGKPNESAQNVQVYFKDYIKNVASSEIYPTWPESAIRANIYAQISFALNRIYTEWYRSKGYDFDITNSTQFDQAYVHGRDVFDNISRIVDEIFNDYVIKQGSVEPYFTQFCNGTTVTCPGLSQWGTVDLAKKGLGPYDILTNYYGKDISLVKNAPVQNVKESYRGFPLRLGSGGNEVKTIQTQLNRIQKNFPAIPKLNRIDGIYGRETQASVKKFQEIFNLNQDGIVGKSTWYKIKDIYNAVKKLSELASEGVKIEEVTPIQLTEVSMGMTGNDVIVLQYFLNVLAYFNDYLAITNVDGVYGQETFNNVKSFQQQYGLPATGVADEQTLIEIRKAYNKLVKSLPPGYEGEKAEVYPGYYLVRGMKDQNVEDLQTYLAFISEEVQKISKPSITGFYGDQTYNTVIEFQKEYGLQPSGIVGPLTWNKIATVYNELKGL